MASLPAMRSTIKVPPFEPMSSFFVMRSWYGLECATPKSLNSPV